MTSAERVGRYQLLEPIGVGPSGTVSRAKVFGVAGFERQFAVKRFHSELTATPAMAQSLSAAARGYGSLEHPRIARMSEYGVAQGTTFTAVEYVAGLDALRLIAESRLAGTSLATGGALALVSQAARAVGYAHGRGLTHLGLSPTNVIVTNEGDIKITDFGILSATLPPRPVDVVRLAHRIQYLAPEQIAGEATSAATDVFALGVLAYELVTGQRTFRGETAQQIAQSVMAGPPPEPPLPRPIVRVLQRCLARSPFERFPDARALADALDAALRVAPVPGTRKDIGAQVKDTLDRIAAMKDGELSGVVALNVGTGPSPRDSASSSPSIATLGRDGGGEMATLEFERPGVANPKPLPSLLGPPATTFPDLPKTPMTTVPGLAPPPIPVPPGLVGSGGAPKPPQPNAPSTLLGMQTAKPGPALPPLRPLPSIPSANPRAATPPPIPIAIPRTMTPPPIPSHDSSSSIPRLPKPPEIEAPEIEIDDPRFEIDDARFETDMPTRTGTDLEIPREPLPVRPRASADTTGDPQRGYAGTDPGMGVSPEYHQRMTDQMSAVLVEKLNEASVRGTAEVPPLVEDAWRHEAYNQFPDESHVADDVAVPAAPVGRTTIAGVPPPGISSPMPIAAPSDSMRAGRQTPSGPMHAPRSPRMQSPTADQTVDVRNQRRPSNMPLIIAGAVGAVVLGIGGWFAYGAFVDDDGGSGSAKVVEPARRDAGAVAVAPADAATRVATSTPDASSAKPAAVDAAVAIAASADAAVATPPDAATVAVKTPDAGTPTTAPSDSLTITSTPAGARVFLDGADAGVTPLKLPGTPDRHTIALLLAGHELYVAQVDGHGAFAIPLKEVTPLAGPAGIKVTKCKDKERYYVFVDGKPTGQTCPTERIEVDVGAHVVEVYDVVSETRKKWEIEVKDTRLSYRVRID